MARRRLPEPQPGRHDDPQLRRLILQYRLACYEADEMESRAAGFPPSSNGDPMFGDAAAARELLRERIGEHLGRPMSHADIDRLRDEIAAQRNRRLEEWRASRRRPAS